MNMGCPEMAAKLFQLQLSTGPRDVTLFVCGNPQCAVPVEDFEFDWRAMGAEIESHPLFPDRTTSRFSEPWTSTSSRRGSMSVGRARP